MEQNKKKRPLKFKRLVERLCEMKWISAVDTDDSKLQYEEFLKSAYGEYKHYCEQENISGKLTTKIIDHSKNCVWLYNSETC